MNITALIRSGDLKGIEAAITANPTIVNQADERGITPLVLATYLNQREVAQLLLHKGANIDAQDPMMGNTALMGVCFKGSIDLAKLLIDKGANIHLKNNDGQTALDFARNSGSEELVRLLS